MLEQKNIRKVFISVLLLSLIYVLFIESERYKSESSILLKDLNSNQAVGLDLSLFGTTPSTQMQDSKVLETYLKSYEVLEKLDNKFNLREYYKSDELDTLNKLSKNSTREDFLEIYLKNIDIFYNEVSGIITISFLHTSRKSSKEILEFILKEAEEKINKYNEINAKKSMAFISKSLQQNKLSLDSAIKDLEEYQNNNLVLDPTSNAQSKTAIISSLEATLVQKQAELEQLNHYMSDNSFDVQNLKNEIVAIKSSIETAKKKLIGNSNDRLNKVLFEFERLKSIVEFETEKYKQSLLQYEMVKNDIEKDAKTLQIISKPNLPDGHTIPNRPLDILDIVIALGLIFGVVSLIISIIKDHRD